MKIKIKNVLKPFKNIRPIRWCRVSNAVCPPHCRAALRLFFLLLLLLGVSFIGGWDCLANGNDVLTGTDASLWATLNGTGKKYIYAVEGILGLTGYMKTKNLLVLTGLVAVSIFLNILLSMAGESA